MQIITPSIINGSYKLEHRRFVDVQSLKHIKHFNFYIKND